MPLFPKYPPIAQYKSRMHRKMHPAQTVKSLAEFADGSRQIKLNIFFVRTRPRAVSLVPLGQFTFCA